MSIHKSVVVLLALSGVCFQAEAEEDAALSSLERSYTAPIQPLVKQYCLGCHSTEKHKGDFDLERFTSADEVLKHPKVWQSVVEQLALGEMPPKEKPQPTPAERERLLAWVNARSTKSRRRARAIPARSCCGG